MTIVRMVATLTAVLLMSPLIVAADELYAGMVTLPALKIITPNDGAVVENPVVIIFETQADLSKMTMGGTMKAGETMQEGTMTMRPHLHIDLDRRVTMPTMKHITRVGSLRYQYSLGSVGQGKHTIRVYWADAKHHKPIGKVHAFSITVKKTRPGGGA